MAKKLPVYSICTITGKKAAANEFFISRFAPYLAERDFLFQAHGHSFYHLVFFTHGGGSQSIDFTHFTVRPGQFYFMIPGQVHNWKFNRETDGYIINFDRSFIDALSDPDKFSFFSGHAAEQVIDLKPASQETVTGIFESILAEDSSPKEYADDMIRTLLLQLFITVDREAGHSDTQKRLKPGYVVLKNFQKLVDEHYSKLRLPTEYAAMLYVTANYLNALCQDLLGKSAGEVIRDRVVLEAKRLLINAGHTIAEIAGQLNFSDNSYFTKFFKKYTGQTPEQFKKEHIHV